MIYRDSAGRFCKADNPNARILPDWAKPKENKSAEPILTEPLRKGVSMYIRDTRNMSQSEKADWKRRWPSFSPSELDSDDWSLKLTETALDALQRIRDRIGKPMRITSAYRNPKHNARVGGRPNSQHLKGLAFDIAVPNKAYAIEVERLAVAEGFTAIGRYPQKHFIHIDMRPAKPSGALYRWGRRWS